MPSAQATSSAAPAICPMALISAPASGQGKTTITAALARHYRQRGKRVTLFKTGPDFLDPMILSRAAGMPVFQLDLFMGGEAHCRDLLYRAARESDVVLVEGVMGLYDGAPSSADLAALFGIPVIGVIDASGMAGTFGALVHGLATYRGGLNFIGAIANGVGSPRHADMLRAGMPEGISLLAALPRMADIALPHRHLGLVQADEIGSLDQKIALAASELGKTLRTELPSVEIHPPVDALPELPNLLCGRRIAVARDAAFSFLYAANLDLLRRMGATLIYFSPLSDGELPDCDAVYLPGGYPELHLSALENGTAMKQAMATHHDAGKPILAECGGMLYLLDSLTDAAGNKASMAGLLSGDAQMRPRLTALALQTVDLPEGRMRGHTFHYSALETNLDSIARGVCPNGNAIAEPVFRVGSLTASYIHLYFPSNPEAAARLFM